MKAKNVEELFGTLQQSVVDEWRKHLKTSKYSKHKALDEFYKDMPDLVDALIEGYNGHTKKKVEDFKCILDAGKLDALQYLEELHEIAQSGYDLIPEDAPEVKSNLDAIKDKIDSVMYQVRELKEGMIKPLTAFLNEALNEAKWRSCNGGFSLEHAEQIAKESGLSLKQTYKALDQFDDEIGGPVEWETNGKKDLTFKNPDAKKAWSYDLDEEEWNEIDYKK